MTEKFSNFIRLEPLPEDIQKIDDFENKYQKQIEEEMNKEIESQK